MPTRDGFRACESNSRCATAFLVVQQCSASMVAVSSQSLKQVIEARISVVFLLANLRATLQLAFIQDIQDSDGFTAGRQIRLTPL